MNGQQLRDAREELGWSRGELVSHTDADLTVAKLAAIESGRRQPTESEADELRRVLLERLGTVLTESGEHPAVVAGADGEDDSVAVEVEVNGTTAVRSYRWNDLRRGDRVRVKGERGAFRFMFHHKDDHQEYVEVYGPPSKPKQRSVRPERVVKRR